MILQLVNAVNLACNSIYALDSTKDFDKLYQVGETICGTVLQDGVFYIVFQGTNNLAGWLADADIFSIEVAPFGHIHSGFYTNLPMIMSLVKSDIPEKTPIIVTGHSKGAGEASIFAAMLKLLKYDVKPILFACPNSGHQQFADWLENNLPGISFRNASDIIIEFGDPVPLIPITPYAAPYEHTLIDMPPDDALIPTSWHQAKLYLAGVCKYATA